MYNVERVREGRSFATRTVQARQRGKPIFTVTLSFMKELQGSERVVSHAVSMPKVPDPLTENAFDNDRGSSSPFESQHLDSINGESSISIFIVFLTDMRVWRRFLTTRAEAYANVD